MKSTTELHTDKSFTIARIECIALEIGAEPSDYYRHTMTNDQLLEVEDMLKTTRKANNERAYQLEKLLREYGVEFYHQRREQYTLDDVAYMEELLAARNDKYEQW